MVYSVFYITQLLQFLYIFHYEWITETSEFFCNMQNSSFSVILSKYK
jgi:hypothetical protein